jgi:hypothetical protein
MIFQTYANYKRRGYASHEAMYSDFYPTGGLEDVWFEPPNSSYSNLSGSLFDQANVRVWEEFLDTHREYDGLWKIAYGGHGTTAIFLHKDALEFQEVRDMIGNLDDYPLLDEAVYDKLFYEATEEAWENWARSSFIRELSEEGVSEDWLDEVSFETLFEMFEEARDKANVYWEEDGPGVSINLGRVATAFVELFGTRPVNLAHDLLVTEGICIDIGDTAYVSSVRGIVTVTPSDDGIRIEVYSHGIKNEAAQEFIVRKEDLDEGL